MALTELTKPEAQDAERKSCGRNTSQFNVADVYDCVYCVIIYQADIYEQQKESKKNSDINPAHPAVLHPTFCPLGLLPRSKPIHPPEQLGRYDLKLLEARLKDQASSIIVKKKMKFSPIWTDPMWLQVNVTYILHLVFLIKASQIVHKSILAEMLLAWHCELLWWLLHQADGPVVLDDLLLALCLLYW